MTNTSSAFYSFFEWVTKLALLNLLWLLFSLVGGILLGIFPSTLAMFAVIRQWLQGDTQLSIRKSFWRYYKADFWKGNALGAFLSILIGLTSLDLFYIKQMHPSPMDIHTFVCLYSINRATVLIYFPYFCSF